MNLNEVNDFITQERERLAGVISQMLIQNTTSEELTWSAIAERYTQDISQKYCMVSLLDARSVCTELEAKSHQWSRVRYVGHPSKLEKPSAIFKI